MTSQYLGNDQWKLKFDGGKIVVFNEHELEEIFTMVERIRIHKEAHHGQVLEGQDKTKESD